MLWYKGKLPNHIHSFARDKSVLWFVWAMCMAAAAEAIAGVAVSAMSVTSSGHGNSDHCSRCYDGSGHGSSDQS